MFTPNSLNALDDATVWETEVYRPGTFTQNPLNAPQHPTGWEARPSTSVSFTVPDNWTSGRVWVRFVVRISLEVIRSNAIYWQGRRDCDFRKPGPNSCVSGGCNGGLKCDPHTGTGVPPATLAEFTFQGAGNKDFYDVSNVDGFNLPMKITNNKGCPVADCPVDLVAKCPARLKGPFNAAGAAVGCQSACKANLDGNPTNSANCCSGKHNTPATCPKSGVQFYSYFKKNCPNAYAYAFDEASESSLFTCDSKLKAHYTITFCP
ncbi:hypothetical protein H2248_007438 [Termitomyces sp. 'cryptogamus']|nr:hypothetical protein H2248_007438 [Termitomyces sp. 'cryptogamus']